jgi:hypothetical protein
MVHVLAEQTQSLVVAPKKSKETNILCEGPLNAKRYYDQGILDRKNGVGQSSITGSIHSIYHLILEGVLVGTLRRFSIRDDVVGRPLYLKERERELEGRRQKIL